MYFYMSYIKPDGNLEIQFSSNLHLALFTSLVTTSFSKNTHHSISMSMSQEQKAAIELAVTTAVAASSNVGAVALKLPPFWDGKPKAWFRHVEAQFHIKGITQDETKFHYTVAALPGSVVNAMDHEIDNATDGEKYKTLKEALLERYVQPPVKQLLDFFSMSPISSDTTPSELADTIRPFANFTTHQIHMALFISKLPTRVQPIISKEAESFKSLREAAKAAEALLAAAPAAPGFISAVRNTSFGSSKFCQYHQKFGPRAKNCVRPCQWKKHPPSKVNAIEHQGDNDNTESGNESFFH